MFCNRLCAFINDPHRGEGANARGARTIKPWDVPVEMRYNQNLSDDDKLALEKRRAVLMRDLKIRPDYDANASINEILVRRNPESAFRLKENREGTQDWLATQMISVRIDISCDGCGGHFDGVGYESVAHTREMVEKAGWVSKKLCNRIFEFCPKCQQEGAVKAKAASG